MSRKRSNDAEGAQTDELESPKKVKIMNVSNQVSDEENQVAQGDCEAKSEHVTEKASNKGLKIKCGYVIKPKKFVKKKRNDLEITKGVVSKDGASAASVTGSANKTGEDSQNLPVPKEQDGMIAIIKPDHLLGVSKEVESLQTPKLSELEKKNAEGSTVTDSDRLSSTDREVEDLLSAMFSNGQEKEGVIASIDSDGMKVEDLQTGIPLVVQKTDKSSNEGGCDFAMRKDESSKNELSVECCEVPHDKDDSLGLLLMDLEDTPVDFPELSQSIVLQVEGLNDYVTIPSQSNSHPKNENDNKEITGNLANGDISILENQSTEKTVIPDNKKVVCNQDEVRFDRQDSPSPTKIIDETAREVMQERTNRPKTQATLANHSIVHTEDEISCTVCEEKIKMTLEGTDIFHSNLIVRNEDGSKVPIESINTIYSVRCENKHLCYFDFEMMEKMKMVPAESSIKYNFVHIEDEISCRICKQKIKIKLEGIDLLHSNMVLIDEDGKNVSIENIKTTYSVHCKNKHLCNFDFGLVEREELQLEEQIDCWEKLKIFLLNGWKKIWN